MTTDTPSVEPYDFASIEPKWQSIWEEKQLFTPKADDKRDPYYALAMFPYPSGAAHCGHVKNYAFIDIVARYQMAQGKAVMNPFGWDAFGLPAENAAIKTGEHPKKSTARHIERMTKQLKRVGTSFDWSRELYTCREDYYKWTQWLFLQMREMKGPSGQPLVYRKQSKVNYCPHDKTVLANEQVVKCTREGKNYDGCFRCETPVVQKELQQWSFRITDYADQLLDSLDDLQGKWPDNVIAQQREWIGRSEGTNIVFNATIGGESAPIEVFTTRADTLFGVTFIALAAEHAYVDRIIAQAPNPDEIKTFVDSTLAMDAEARATADKAGIDTGVRAIHPFTGEEVPVYIGNYVLMYGTGAVMAVPAHDQRDFEFAKEYELPIKRVVACIDEADQATREQFRSCESGEAAFVEKGLLHDSGEFSGKSSDAAIAAIQDALSTKDLGGKTINYRLRDWGLSRQRYWGCPIPVVHCESCGLVPVPEDQLPVELPDDAEFVPTGRSPLETHPSFAKTTCPKCGREDARRDSDTMDTFVDSSWYYLRYCDPNNSDLIAARDQVDRWMPVDQYIGGSEHAILHLIYARFMNKVMRDIGLTSADEPFSRLYTQGMIHKESYRLKTENYRYLTIEEYQEGIKSGAFSEDDVEKRAEKMSKSALNVVDPEYLIDQYGADTLRAYIMFMGPADAETHWDAAAVNGVHKFIQRWWAETHGWIEHLGDIKEGECSKVGKELRRMSHLFIQKCEREYSEHFGFNTVISKAMEVLNFLRAQKPELAKNPADGFAIREALETLAQCLAPITPHVSEELWKVLGKEGTVVETPWPTFREELTAQDEMPIGVQVNGKVRATIHIAATSTKEEIEAIAMAEENVQRHIEGKTIRKVIVIPQKIVNIVAN